jgi:hypothetical protein
MKAIVDPSKLRIGIIETIFSSSACIRFTIDLPSEYLPVSGILYAFSQYALPVLVMQSIKSLLLQRSI